MQIPDLLIIVTQICLVFTRKHAATQISHESCDKNGELTLKYENDFCSDNLLYLQAHKLSKKEIKDGKEVKSSRTAQQLPWSEL